MLPPTSNRFFALSKEAMDPTDVRLEMEDLQGRNGKTKETQMSEVSSVSIINFMTCLTTASAFDL